MTKPTFSIRENQDGSWDVIETETGLSLEGMGFRLADLTEQDAKDWLALMLIRGRLNSIREKLNKPK